MRLINILQSAGGIIRLLSAAFIVPIIVAMLYREWGNIAGFVIGGVVSFGIGQVLVSLSRDTEADLRRIEALAVVAGSWLALAFLCAVPYLWSGFSVINALFESMSGITATGATIITDFETPPRSLFFWRAITQWLGGMGVITLVVAVLPRLSVGVRQLFVVETTAGPTEEKLAPQVRRTAISLWRLYTALTATLAVLLMIVGMPAYDALCHAMTTLAAGGFSPNAQSIMGYNSAIIEWIICFFMFLAGANFALQYRVLLGRPLVLFRDHEFKTYIGIIVVAVVALSLLLWHREGDTAPIRHAVFQTLSIITTTGYASVDFGLWTDQTKVVLLGLMFIGGCAGSAAGGPKVLRHMLMSRFTLVGLRRMLHPRAVLPVKLGSIVVPESVIRSVLLFFFFYILTFAVCVVVVISLGEDLETGITATFGALGNIGPGLGAVGPMLNYEEIHSVSKIVLIVAMWIGRLEIVTVLALLRLEVWTNSHWRGIVDRQ